MVNGFIRVDPLKLAFNLLTFDDRRAANEAYFRRIEQEELLGRDGAAFARASRFGTTNPAFFDDRRDGHGPRYYDGLDRSEGPEFRRVSSVRAGGVGTPPDANMVAAFIEALTAQGFTVTPPQAAPAQQAPAVVQPQAQQNNGPSTQQQTAVAALGNISADGIKRGDGSDSPDPEVKLLQDIAIALGLGEILSRGGITPNDGIAGNRTKEVTELLRQQMQTAGVNVTAPTDGSLFSAAELRALANNFDTIQQSMGRARTATVAPANAPAAGNGLNANAAAQALAAAAPLRNNGANVAAVAVTSPPASTPADFRADPAFYRGGGRDA